MEDKQYGGKHKLIMDARRTIALTGIRDVLSFDAAEVLLDTEQGMLMIRGDELHVSRLSLEKGEVDVDGRVDSLTYSEKDNMKQSAGSFLNRLFR